MAIAVVAAGYAGRAYLDRWAERPNGEGGSVEIVLAPGASTRDVAERLAFEGLIDHAETFVVYSYLEGKLGSIQAGEYAFDTPITPLALLAGLQHGKFERRLTIPEGLTAEQVDALLEREGWIRERGEWLELAARPVEREFFGERIEAGAEGFCFPETYFLDPEDDAERIRERMLRQFARVWTELEPERRGADSEGMTMLEIVTLASMIEREARRADEMPKIASVYFNRLKIGMKLQCCATVYYALGGAWDRPLTRADLKIDSPYNTYLAKGLPPGPIANPGREAIEAVLRPAETDHLFYVYRGDGTHEFTRTYAEHQRAARRFRRADPAAEFVTDRD